MQPKSRDRFDDETFMRLAIEAASEAASHGEVPVGAVVVRGALLGEAVVEGEVVEGEVVGGEVALSNPERIPGGIDRYGPRVLAVAANRREELGDPTAHAEILALRDAAMRLGSWRLNGATLYVTLEPCPMCAGALVAARVHRVVFGAPDPKAGSCGSLYNLCVDPRLNHEVEVRSGVLADECSTMLSEFFASRR